MVLKNKYYSSSFIKFFFLKSHLPYLLFMHPLTSIFYVSKGKLKIKPFEINITKTIFNNILH